MLENAEHVKNAALRDVTFQLFVLSVVKFDLYSRAPSALLHLLTSANAEHLPTAIARLLKLGVDKCDSLGVCALHFIILCEGQ